MTKVYLVRQHHVERMSVESAWWSENEAYTEAAKLAHEDARQTRAAVPSGQVRVKRAATDANVWFVQKAVPRYPGAKSVEWHTLRHYSVSQHTVQGSAVHRLAELAS